MQAPLDIAITLEMQDTSLHGHLTSEGDTPRAFNGWVELLTQLDGAIEAHRPHPAHTEAHSHGGGSNGMSCVYGRRS
jgi:hypothetical protein